MKRFLYIPLHSKGSQSSAHRLTAQELEVRSLYHLYSLKTKSSRSHYVVMTRSETKPSTAIPAPVSGHQQ